MPIRIERKKKQIQTNAHKHVRMDVYSRNCNRKQQQQQKYEKEPSSSCISSYITNVARLTLFILHLGTKVRVNVWILMKLTLCAVNVKLKRRTKNNQTQSTQQN